MVGTLKNMVFQGAGAIAGLIWFRPAMLAIVISLGTLAR
jgi:hypothetical protein